MTLNPCIECGQRAGHTILGGSCTRCARDNRLFVLRAVADELEKAWSDYCDTIYRVEVWEGERVPPASDRTRSHGVQGEPATGQVSNRTNDKVGLSSPMKQERVRSSNTDWEDELTDED